jgi:hypothetical protein
LRKYTFLIISICLLLSFISGCRGPYSGAIHLPNDSNVPPFNPEIDFEEGGTLILSLATSNQSTKDIAINWCPDSTGGASCTPDANGTLSKYSPCVSSHKSRHWDHKDPKAPPTYTEYVYTCKIKKNPTPTGGGAPQPKTYYYTFTTTTDATPPTVNPGSPTTNAGSPATSGVYSFNVQQCTSPCKMPIGTK